MTAVNSQEAVRIIRENVDAFNAGDWDRMRAQLAPDAVWEEVATGRRQEGPDAIIELARGWREAFPDARGTVRNAVGDDETAALEMIYEGTHDGALESPQGTIPPSGKRVTMQGAQVARVADGKIVEVREYFDIMTLMTQIGAAPPA